jgi:hypothetical protein
LDQKDEKNFSAVFFFFFHFWSSIPWIQIRSGSAIVSGSGFNESGSTTLLKNPKNYANMNTIHRAGDQQRSASLFKRIKLQASMSKNFLGPGKSADPQHRMVRYSNN